ISVARARPSAGYTSAVTLAPAAPAEPETRTSTESSEGLFTRVFCLGVGLQIVFDRHHAELVRDNGSRDDPICIVQHDAFERDMAMIDDDVNRRVGSDRVIPEVRVAVNRPSNAI